jgi:hypothetical protein
MAAVVASLDDDEPPPPPPPPPPDFFALEVELVDELDDVLPDVALAALLDEVELLSVLVLEAAFDVLDAFVPLLLLVVPV